MSHSKKTKIKNLSRREFLKALGLTSGAVVLAGCAPKTTQPASTEPPTEPPAPKSTATTAPVTEVKPTATLEPTTAPVVEVLQPTPDANGCVTDWMTTYPSFEKYSPPVEIKIPFRSMNFFYEGETFENNPSHNLILEKLGINYVQAYEVTGSEYYTRLNNDLAAGTLPDVFRVGNSRLGQFIDIGAVEDITDIFEATASDLVKQKKGYPDSSIWNGVKRDGRILGVAYLEDGFTSDSLAFVRTDWLEKVGKQSPKTIDEVTEVARAFKEAGLCDFPIGACQNLVTWQFSLDPVFGAFGAMTGVGSGDNWWLKNPDGTLRNGTLDPGIKDALALLKGWYDDGLIDPDFINKDESLAGEAALAGQMGLFYAPWWTGNALLPDVYAAFPEAKVDVIPLPVGPQGRKGRAGTQLKGNAFLFRKGLDPKIIEANIKQLNWQMEIHVNWIKNKAYGEAFQGAFFIRGYEWDLDQDCNMILGPIPDSEWRYQQDLVWGYRGATYPEYQAEIFQEMAQWVKEDPSKLDSAKKFILNNRARMDNMAFFNYAFDTRDEVIQNYFMGANTETINEVLTDITDFERTAFLEFITGARSLDNFEDFKQEWMDRGGTVYSEEVNKWAAENL